MNTSGLTPTSVVFIPALLCDEAMYCDVIEVLGEMIEVHVLLSPKMRLEDSAADILARARTSTFSQVAGICQRWRSRFDWGHHRFNMLETTLVLCYINPF